MISRMRTNSFLIFFLFLLSYPYIAHAEIEKIAIPSDKGFTLYWWPKLPTIPGWHQDRNQSYQFKANALTLDGTTFANAETIMYAKAIFKPRHPDAKSIDMFISKDVKDFLLNVPGIEIRETERLATADGKKLRSFEFIPVKSGNWEKVTYGEEGEFFLICTLSSRSKKGYEARLIDYENLIHRYKEINNVPRKARKL